jgi:ABC-2 type transport system ATP-binding protein
VTAAVEMRGLTRRFGQMLAVSGVDLDIASGDIFGLVGPNGAGKTTTMRMLATLLEPTSGEARICGLDVRSQPNSVRRLIGFMPDTFGVYDDMRVWEYLDFFAHVYVMSASKRQTIVNDLLELVDLTSKRDAYVQSLSRGMQQRLCLAHALVHDPLVLLLDEPASGLDPRARAELRELLRELSGMGKTIIISSHILPELEELCSAVAIIDRGRVLASGPVADIEARFRRGSVLRARIVGGPDEWQAAERFFHAQPEVASVAILPDGRVELALPADEQDIARLLYRAMSDGHMVSAFAPVASDLEELFLQITDPQTDELAAYGPLPPPPPPPAPAQPEAES